MNVVQPVLRGSVIRRLKMQLRMGRLGWGPLSLIMRGESQVPSHHTTGPDPREAENWSPTDGTGLKPVVLFIEGTHTGTAMVNTLCTFSRLGWSEDPSNATDFTAHSGPIHLVK